MARRKLTEEEKIQSKEARKEYEWKYHSRPENKERMRLYHKRYYAEHKGKMRKKQKAAHKRRKEAQPDSLKFVFGTHGN